MDASDPIVSWSAFELERRLKRADTLKEKSAVWRDADRARPKGLQGTTETLGRGTRVASV